MGINYRKYKNYKEYLSHQSIKLDIGIKKKIKKFMPEYFENNVRSFEKRIEKFKEYVKNGKVLCLGARLGAEVVAFRNMGFKETLGIDINPGKSNKYVIKGDFHNVPFEDKYFDVVYCNCIDHCWNLKLLSMETDRVLKNDGVLILEIDHLNKDKKRNKKWINNDDKYESILYEGLKDIEKGLKEFELIFKFNSVHRKFIVAIFKKVKSE